MLRGSKPAHPYTAPVPKRGCVGDQPQQVRSSSGVGHSKAFVRKRLPRLTFQAQSRSGRSTRRRQIEAGTSNGFVDALEIDAIMSL